MKNKRINVLIGNSPPWFPSQPYLSCPLITGVLRDHGFCVYQKDFNLSFFDNLLTKSEIHSQFKQIDTKSIAGDKFAQLVSLREHIEENIEVSKQQFKQNDKLSFEERKALIVFFDLVLKVYSFNYPSTILSLGDIEYNFNYLSRELLVRELENDLNVFAYYFEKYELENILNLEIDILALSITSPEQLFPALSFLKVLREQKRIKVLLGGEYVTKAHKSLVGHNDLNKYFDFLFLGDLNYSIIDFLKSLSDGKEPLSDFGNTYIKHKPFIIRQKGRPINALYADFSDLTLDEYFSIQKTLPVEVSKGCYWGRCNFCDIKGRHYYQYPTESITGLLNKYQKVYGVANFSFVSPSPSPRFLHSITKELSETQYNWSSFLRPEPYITKQFAQELFMGGCRLVFVGIESASQKVLNSMNKGLDIAETQNVLINLFNAGIKVHGYFMFNYMAEEHEDRILTHDFILKNKRYFHSMSFTTFANPRRPCDIFDNNLSLYNYIPVDENLERQLNYYANFSFDRHLNLNIDLL